MEILKDLWGKSDGKKTYGLAIATILVALIGHFFGPIQIDGNIAVPHYSWFNIYQIAVTGGFFAALRHGVTKIIKALKEKKA